MKIQLALLFDKKSGSHIVAVISTLVSQQEGCKDVNDLLTGDWQ